MTTENDIENILKTLRRQLPFLQRRYMVATLDVFGSFARNEQRPESDLDILVTFSETPSLFKFIELEDHLSSILGIRIDLVMKSALKRHIGQRITREAIAV